MSEEEREIWEEKAAVYEFLGGFSREEAERLATESMEAWRAAK